MKLVQAVIQPHRLEAVLAALEKVAVERLTIVDGSGFGRQRGLLETQDRPVHPRQHRLLRKAVLEIVVNDDFVERTVEAIGAASRTGAEGRIGDGKIWVTAVEQTVLIGGTERGPGAV